MLEIGFLGTGLISHMHALLLRASSVGSRIVAVHDPDAARAEGFAARYGGEAVGEQQVLERAAVVFVTPWTSEHPRLVQAAAARGRAVFCEKPLAVDARLAAEMVEAVERAGVPSQVGLVLRFTPQFVWARHLLADPGAGRLLAVSFRDDQYLPVQGIYGSSWRKDARRAGRGALLEHSIHDVDVLHWLGGPVERVSGVVREVHGHARIDDVAVARLEFESGGVASLTSVWHDVLERPSLRHVEFFCERLYLALLGDGSVTWQRAGGASRSLGGEELVAACLDAGAAPVRETATLAGQTLFNPATAFLTAVRDGHPPPLPLRTALPAHALVDAIYVSADRGGAPVETGPAR